MSQLDQMFEASGPDFGIVWGDFHAAEELLATATQDVILELGGTELIGAIKAVLERNDAPFHHPAVIGILQEFRPGAGARVVSRMETLGEQRRAAELAEAQCLTKHPLRHAGHIIVAKFKS